MLFRSMIMAELDDWMAGAYAGAVLPDPVIVPAGILELAYGDSHDHIICPCRPKMDLCGRFCPEVAVVMDVDGTECPVCLDIWLNGVCPGCGCSKDETCERCA